MANASAVYQGLIDRGIPPHVAEGIVMNAEDESGFRTDINEAAPIVPGSRGGYGLMQWTGPRRKQLESYAASHGSNVSDLDTQLDFLVYELQGPEKAAYQKTLAAGNAGDAAAAFATNFLRPSQEHLSRRVAEYTGGSGSDYMLGGSGGDDLSVPSTQPSFEMPEPMEEPKIENFLRTAMDQRAQRMPNRKASGMFRFDPVSGTMRY